MISHRGFLRKCLMPAVAGCLLLSCGKETPPVAEEQGDPSLDNIAFNVPEGWPQPVYNFEDNRLTKEGFSLGRKLFFETMLSSDNKVSCGSCHQPFAAFAQLGHDISHGVDDRIGTRNSPALFNLNWHQHFFWDGGTQHLEDQPEAPILNPLEMNETLENIIRKLEVDSSYPLLFKEAFGSEQITAPLISKALVQFMGMLVSAGSRYDKYVRGEQGGSLSAGELNGLSIFRNKCNACHREPLFSDFSLRNNGLALVINSQNAVDAGRGIIEPGDSSVYYTFKVPSLRNLSYTAPYMHDGRFRSIDEELDHYASGIHQTRNLDPLLSSGIPLSAAERSDLKAFLLSLDDEAFVKDLRFREPGQ